MARAHFEILAVAGGLGGVLPSCMLSYSHCQIIFVLVWSFETIDVELTHFGKAKYRRTIRKLIRLFHEVVMIPNKHL